MGVNVNALANDRWARRRDISADFVRQFINYGCPLDLLILGSGFRDSRLLDKAYKLVGGEARGKPDLRKQQQKLDEWLDKGGKLEDAILCVDMGRFSQKKVDEYVLGHPEVLEKMYAAGIDRVSSSVLVNLAKQGKLKFNNDSFMQRSIEEDTDVKEKVPYDLRWKNALESKSISCLTQEDMMKLTPEKLGDLASGGCVDLGLLPAEKIEMIGQDAWSEWFKKVDGADMVISTKILEQIDVGDFVDKLRKGNIAKNQEDVWDTMYSFNVSTDVMRECISNGGDFYLFGVRHLEHLTQDEINTFAKQGKKLVGLTAKQIEGIPMETLMLNLSMNGIDNAEYVADQVSSNPKYDGLASLDINLNGDVYKYLLPSIIAFGGGDIRRMEDLPKEVFLNGKTMKALLSVVEGQTVRAFMNRLPPNAEEINPAMKEVFDDELLKMKGMVMAQRDAVISQELKSMGYSSSLGSKAKETEFGM